MRKFFSALRIGEGFVYSHATTSASAEFETLADAEVVVGRHVVHLVEAFQTDAVGLGDGVHGFALTDIVQTTLVVLGCLLLLLLQPDDLALGEAVVL